LADAVDEPAEVSELWIGALTKAGVGVGTANVSNLARGEPGVRG
jgi:hypothetical protein